MGQWVRRIRAAIGMGLIWAFGWFGAGLLLLLVVGLDAADVPFPLGFAALGFLAGATFSVVLGIVERRRRFDQLTLPRFAAWGALGGMLMSGVFILLVALSGDAPPEILVVAPVFSVAASASAAGTLALARKGDEQKRLESR